MTHFQKWWLKFKRKNPNFDQPNDTKFTMTIGNLRKVLTQAHKHGFSCGMETSKDIEKLKGTDPNSFGDLMNMFKGHK